MKVGFGMSRAREADAALQEAYRKSLQKLGATKADLSLVFYSYDFALDQPAFAGSLKRVFRDVPVYGCSSWGSWNQAESLEAETGLMVVSFKAPDFTVTPLKVHSLREKAELWSAELARQLETQSFDFVLVLADSLNFTSGSGFQMLERKFPSTQFVGVGTSFSVPQCSLVCQSEVHLNALVALGFSNFKPWVGLLQSIRPELKEVSINRMSENLIIEMDEKPAFYKLCEHLMTVDDLPMMSQDEFRKHMGNLYVVEKSKEEPSRLRTFGDSYRVISLLGSEMTTGMVAVAQTLDFSQSHFLGQKKNQYAEVGGIELLQKLKSEIPEPSMLWVFVNAARLREKERTKSDYELIQSVFPQTPILGLTSNGEYLGGLNQMAALVVAVP